MIGVGHIVKVADFGLSTIHKARTKLTNKSISSLSSLMHIGNRTSNIKSVKRSSSSSGRLNDPLLLHQSSTDANKENTKFELRASTTMIGTANFMAPEIMNSDIKEYTNSVDVFSFGKSYYLYS